MRSAGRERLGVQGKRRERTVQKLGIWVKSERERDTDIERERANQLANQLARETQFSYCPMCSLIIVCLVTNIERERARINLRESGQESAHTPGRERKRDREPGRGKEGGMERGMEGGRGGGGEKGREGGREEGGREGKSERQPDENGGRVWSTT